TLLHRETNGNPFFLGEILRLLASEGHLDVPLAGGLVPPSVSEVISRRAARLGDGCRALLGVAALLGDTIDPSLLEEILREERAIEPASVADDLHRAARDRILVELHGRQGRYAFAHALIRRVLADELEPSARAAWHARIAAALERRAASSGV